LLAPVAWLATQYDRYQIDGDAMAYMDIADLMRAHHWAGVVNGYWNPLYPAGLAVAQAVFHTTRANELRAYYALNFVIFLVSVVAMLAFVGALVRLRGKMVATSPTRDDETVAGGAPSPLLGMDALRLVGLGLVVIASQRELSMGKVRPDLLLQALLLGAFAMLLQALATESLVFAPVMGLLLGLAYLTKSFAFVVALLTIAVMMLVQLVMQRRRLGRVVLGGVFAAVAFAAVAGPYVAALSKQKGRFDFGDSGALNYAWYVSGTNKMHIEPWMTASFGSAEVSLQHPERQLLFEPGVFSYKDEPYGTYPAWFDPTYFHERIVPRFDLRRLVRRDARNVVLSLRYVLNHPEGWVLLVLLLGIGARVALGRWREAWWVAPVVLGLAMWGIYGLVNIEERYVTLAYLVIVLPVFAMLRAVEGKRQVATALVVLFATLALGESLRLALEARRSESAEGLPSAWYSPSMYGAAAALNAMGVGQGDEIACMGTMACLHDPYWMRLAGVRVTTEVYNPDPRHLREEWEGLPNRAQVVEVLRAQGAKVLVASFDGASAGDGFCEGGKELRSKIGCDWIRLGESHLYALPLTAVAPLPTKPKRMWDMTRQEAP
jgi:hypothetical protein